MYNSTANWTSRCALHMAYVIADTLKASHVRPMTHDKWMHHSVKAITTFIQTRLHFIWHVISNSTVLYKMGFIYKQLCFSIMLYACFAISRSRNVNKGLDNQHSISVQSSGLQSNIESLNIAVLTTFKS